ncbi:hypothetical protein [Vreelandella profundi]|nr:MULTISPECIES: hypothetical protein [Halomonas]MDN7131433.1 hypothetical protein [Halomonas sp. MC140]
MTLIWMVDYVGGVKGILGLVILVSSLVSLRATLDCSNAQPVG